MNHDTLIGILLFFILPLFGQETQAPFRMEREFTPFPQTITLEDGLSHREVNTIFQDSRGLIWFGTRNGLDRYDGYTVTNWPRRPDLESLNGIRMIREDASGILWLFAFPGRSVEPAIFLLHPNEAAPRSLDRSFPDQLPFSEKSVRGNCLTTANKTLLLGVSNPGALISYHPDAGFRYYPLPGVHSFAPIGLSARQTVWGVADSTRLMEVDQQGRVLRQRPFDHPLLIPGEQTGPELLIAERIEGRQFRYYLIDWRGIIEEAPAGPLRLPVEPDYQHSVLLPAISGDWWWNGRQLIRRSTQSIALNPAAGIPEQIAPQGLRSWLIDRSGNFWLGTNHGVYLFHHRENRFQHYLYREKLAPFNYNSARGIAMVGKKLYVNLEEEGLQEIDLSTSVTRSLLPPESPEDRCFAVLPWANGRALFAGRGEQLTYLPLSGQAPKNWPAPGLVLHIYPLQADRLLLGTSKGLAVFDSSRQQVLPFSQYGLFSELADAEIRWIGPDRHSTLWICANTGLYRFHPQQGVQARYWSGGRGEHFLPSKEFQHLLQDTAEVYWLGTQGDGLIRWDPRAGEVRKITRLDSLPNNIIYAVYEDEAHQHLWMSSDQGIIQFNKTTFRCRTYLEAEGITHHEFNRTSHFQAADGRLFFGGLNGVTAFFPQDFPEQDSLTDIPLVITGFQQFDRRANRWMDRTGTLLQNMHVTLGARTTFFNVEFALLAFEKVLKPRYAYQIKGLNETWNFQREPVIRFTRLPYGHYTLLIKGQNSAGQWSRQTLSIPILVRKPIYLQFWFLLLLLFILAGAVAGFLRLRTWQLRRNKALLEAEVARQTRLIRQDKATIEKQSEELRRLDHVKSRFFTNLSHELRTPLTLILGPVRDLKKNKKQDILELQRLQLIENNALTLLELVNEIQDLSKLEAGEMPLEEQAVALYPETRNTIERFRLMAQQQDIQLSLNFYPAKDLALMLDREKFEKILSNLLANALKFNHPRGQVHISVRDLGASIQLEVADTGRGIHPDDLPFIFDRYFQSKRQEAPPEGGAGIGLALCRELAQLFGGHITVESRWGKGATFTFHFPKKTGILPDQLPETEPPLPLPRALQVSDERQLPQVPLAALNAETVLIVEDHPSMMNYLISILQPRFRIREARHGEEALRLLADTGSDNDRIDLVLCDIMMPVMDGLSLIQHLKEEEQWRGIPVVAITAHTGLEKKLAALRIGVDDYLLKPFHPEELLARIDNLLQNHRNRRQWRMHQHPMLQSAEQSKAKAPTADPLSSPHYFTTISTEEAQWLDDLEAVVLQHISDFDFNLEKLSSLMAISRRQFNRRLKKLTGLTPHKYVKELHLQEARRLLENRTFSTVKAVAYSVGMKDTEYFSREFRKRFGLLPSEYLQNDPDGLPNA